MAQVTFSGELKLGRVNTVGGGGGVYDPSTEFNTLTMPSGYANSNGFYTLSGSALVFSPSSAVYFVSPAGSWQLDVKATASGTAGYMGLEIGRDPMTLWSFYADLASGPSFFLGSGAEAYSTTMPITTAYFRVKNDNGALTFEYSTDGSTYTELEPSEDEGDPAEVATDTGSIVTLSSGGDTEEFSFDYVRFTAL